MLSRWPYLFSRVRGKVNDPCQNTALEIEGISPHSPIEDVYAIVVGCILITVGMTILAAAQVVTGGMAGITLLVSHFLPITPGVLLGLLNIPFLLFSFRTMGRSFTSRTIVVLIGIMAFSAILNLTMTVRVSNPAVAALAGGILIGMGILSLARHGASVGGTGVVTLWLQQVRGWNAGSSQIVIDLIILGCSSFFLPWSSLPWSVLSAIALSTVLVFWHRPGRYTGNSTDRPLSNRS